MAENPNTPQNTEWKKFTRFLVHVFYFFLAILLFIAALPYLTEFTSPAIILLLYYGMVISIFLLIIEIIYFCRLKKPCKTPRLVKRYLGFLTAVVGRGILYQLLGLHYLMMDRWQRWGNSVILSVFFGWVVWFFGLCLTAFAILAKAYDFADWIEDEVEEEDEGELRLESNDEEDMNIGLLVDQVV